LERALEKMLARFSIEKLQVRAVDVNEQNTNAAAFYEQWVSFAMSELKRMIRVKSTRSLGSGR